MRKFPQDLFYDFRSINIDRKDKLYYMKEIDKEKGMKNNAPILKNNVDILNQNNENSKKKKLGLEHIIVKNERKIENFQNNSFENIRSNVEKTMFSNIKKDNKNNNNSNNNSNNNNDDVKIENEEKIQKENMNSEGFILQNNSIYKIKSKSNKDNKSKSDVDSLNCSHNCSNRAQECPHIFEDSFEQLINTFKCKYTDIFISLDYMCNEILNYTRFQAYDETFYFINKLFNQCIELPYSQIHISKVMQNFTENIIYKRYKTKLKKKYIFSEKYKRAVKKMNMFWEEFKKDIAFLKKNQCIEKIGNERKNYIKANSYDIITNKEKDDIKIGNDSYIKNNSCQYFFSLSHFTKIVKKWKDMLFIIIYSLKENQFLKDFSFSLCDMFSKFNTRIELPGQRLKYMGEFLNYHCNLNFFVPTNIINLNSYILISVRNNYCLNKISFFANDGNIYYYTIQPCNFIRYKSEHKCMLLQILLNNIMFKYSQTKKRGLSLKINTHTPLHPSFRLMDDSIDNITLEELYNDSILVIKDQKFLSDNVLLYHRDLIKSSIRKHLLKKVESITIEDQGTTKDVLNKSSMEEININEENIIKASIISKNVCEDNENAKIIANMNCNSCENTESMKSMKNINWDTLSFEELISHLSDKTWFYKYFKKCEKKCLKMHFKDICKMVPKNIMKNYFYALHNNLESYYILNTQFIKSYSVLCMLNYIFFQLNTSLNKIILSKYSGRTMYLEGKPLYNDLTIKKEVYKNIPFRLTRNIQHFMGFQGLHGSFPSCFYSAIMAIKKKTKYIKNFLNLAISDDFISLHIYKKNRSVLQTRSNEKREDKMNAYIKSFYVEDFEKRNILRNAENYVNNIFCRVLCLYKNRLEKRNDISPKNKKKRKKVEINFYEYCSEIEDISLSELSSDDNSEYYNLNEDIDLRNMKKKNENKINKENNINLQVPMKENRSSKNLKSLVKKEEIEDEIKKSDSVNTQTIVKRIVNDKSLNFVFDIDKEEMNNKKQEKSNCYLGEEKEIKKDSYIIQEHEEQLQHQVQQLLQQKMLHQMKNRQKNYSNNTGKYMEEEDIEDFEKEGEETNDDTKYNENKGEDEEKEKNKKYKIKKKKYITDVNKSVIDLIEMSMNTKYLKNTKPTWFPWF